ncbi:hypothetical protein [Spirosoma utsteinense]|nr:hypothetical protein [Spirosoma utsteinense]MBC3784203.1 hypothetical protein [Spirosoma utsteinense]
MARKGIVYLDTNSLSQPDSTRPAQPALLLTGDIELTKSFSVMRVQEGTFVQSTPWYLTGNLVLATRGGWTIPIQGMWSSPINGYGQAYNAIGVSPRYRNWLTLHGGYRNLEFSPFTLAGYTVRGAGFELNPGLLRVGLMVGRFSKAVEPSATDPDRPATFRRMGYCARIGVGTDRTYLDVILLNAADDASSILPDSTGYLTPAQNVVLGLSGRIRANKKLTVELDAAGSSYTSDTHAEPQPTAPVDRRSKYVNYLNGYRHLMPVNSSTSIRTALQASLNYRLKWADLRLRYTRVEPGYQSMGVNYLQTDIERVTVAPTVRLFKNRLQFRSSVGWQHDNLTAQKRTRTDRLIGSVSTSYTSDDNLTLDLSVSNYGLTQQAGYRPLNDTTRIAQNNRTLSGSVFKSWTGQGQLHTLNGSVMYQALQDLNPFTADNNHRQNWTYTVSYTRQNPATGLDLNFGYTYTLSQATAMSFLFHGPTVSIEKKLFTNKLRAFILGSYLKNNQILAGERQQGFTIDYTLTFDYQLTPVHRLSISGTTGINRGAQSYRQQQGIVQYTVSF